jgi:chaperone modulatory protein CbpM
MTEQNMYLQGMVLDEETLCTLADLCRCCGVSAEIIHAMIDEGIITPKGVSPQEWRFTFVAIKRVRTTVRLQQDLGVNLPGCALAIELLEELDQLRRISRRS